MKIIVYGSQSVESHRSTKPAIPYRVQGSTGSCVGADGGLSEGVACHVAAIT